MYHLYHLLGVDLARRCVSGEDGRLHLAKLPDVVLPLPINLILFIQITVLIILVELISLAKVSNYPTASVLVRKLA